MLSTNPTEISHLLGVIMMLFALKIDFITQAMNSESLNAEQTTLFNNILAEQRD